MLFHDVHHAFPNAVGTLSQRGRFHGWEKVHDAAAEARGARGESGRRAGGRRGNQGSHLLVSYQNTCLVEAPNSEGKGKGVGTSPIPVYSLHGGSPRLFNRPTFGVPFERGMVAPCCASEANGNRKNLKRSSGEVP